MAIFTKDGKVYVVEGPNPLVNKQASWDASKLVFHNFEWDDITQEASRTTRHRKRSPEPPAPAPSIPVVEVQREETPVVEAQREEIPAEPPPPQPPAESAAPEIDEGERPFDLPYIKYKVLCHCLPARLEQRTDSLYGDSWGRVKYGTKFVFPCVVTSSSDLSLEFWTSDPRGQITERSIVYPFSYEVHNRETDAYDRVPYDDYRWWRVASKEQKEGGWLFIANPSDFQPDFSD